MDFVLVMMWCSIKFVLPGLILRTSSNSSNKSLRLFCSFVVKCFLNVGVPTLSAVAGCQVGTSSARTCSSTYSARLTPGWVPFLQHVDVKSTFMFSVVIHINTVTHWAHSRPPSNIPV